MVKVIQQKKKYYDKYNKLYNICNKYKKPKNVGF